MTSLDDFPKEKREVVIDQKQFEHYHNRKRPEKEMAKDMALLEKLVLSTATRKYDPKDTMNIIHIILSSYSFRIDTLKYFRLGLVIVFCFLVGFIAMDIATGLGLF